MAGLPHTTQQRRYLAAQKQEDSYQGSRCGIEDEFQSGRGGATRLKGMHVRRDGGATEFSGMHIQGGVDELASYLPAKLAIPELASYFSRPPSPTDSATGAQRQGNFWGT